MLPRDVLFLRMKTFSFFYRFIFTNIAFRFDSMSDDKYSASDRIDLHVSSNLFGFTYCTKSLHVSFPITKMWLSFIWICSIIKCSLINSEIKVQVFSIVPFHLTWRVLPPKNSKSIHEILDIFCRNNSRDSFHILKSFSALLQKWYYIRSRGHY